MAPEVSDGSVRDWHAADAWALGVTLYILLTGRPLYTDPEDRAFDLLAGGAVREVLAHYATYVFGARVYVIDRAPHPPP